MNELTAPFTPEQVEKLNAYQMAGNYHPFTGNPEAAGRKYRSECPDRQCLLKATEGGWVCPCGAYTQDWAHAHMAE